MSNKKPRSSQERLLDHRSLLTKINQYNNARLFEYSELIHKIAKNHTTRTRKALMMAKRLDDDYEENPDDQTLFEINILIRQLDEATQIFVEKVISKIIKMMKRHDYKADNLKKHQKKLKQQFSIKNRDSDVSVREVLHDLERFEQEFSDGLIYFLNRKHDERQK